MTEKEPCQGRAGAWSQGMVIGRVQKLNYTHQNTPHQHVDATQVCEQLERFDMSINAALEELDKEQAYLCQNQHAESLHVLDIHRMLLQDNDWLNDIRDKIEKQCINAEWALFQKINELLTFFNQLQNSHFKNKKLDIEQAGDRILRHLASQIHVKTVLSTKEPLIFIAQNFHPADVIQLWRKHMKGIVSKQGGTNSHAMIIARSIGLPALMGVDHLIDMASDGDLLVLNAELGYWSLNPSESELDVYRQEFNATNLEQSRLQHYIHRLPSTTKSPSLMVNVELIEELELVKELEVDGIGLFRTEFIFANASQIPTLEQQYRYYVQAVRAMQGKDVTFRLMDIGGDKPTLFQRLLHRAPKGMNPLMGMRGIRLLLENMPLLYTQIKAILMAAKEGSVRIVIPMVHRCEEVIAVREALVLCQNELNIHIDIPLGVVIEIPAAVMIADQLADICDFLSIGTNDLIQYTLATDRNNEYMANSYTDQHPAILEMLKITVKKAKSKNTELSICGEIAGDPAWTQILMDLGITHLSMSPHSILRVRQRLSTK
ncbi:MAG: phosphoenolpyruvate--protein phosphotransferase [Mariprofundaceae bacterium]|nr:phosphoenolpyruvate--protein phosphotransferase [Mariprofundaceae bacterium]